MSWKTAIAVCGALGVLYACGCCVRASLPEYGREPDTFGSLDVYEHKPATTLVGEFRGTIAGFLYMRADEYMHGGVVMRPATQQEVESGVRLASHGDAMRDTHGGGETSIVPEPERDQRGFWGNIERDTQPFMDIRHHQHRDMRESLPLFRMMTWCDPHFVEGYNFGAFIVFSAADGDRLKRAMEFLEEGIRNNPQSYILHTEYGMYQMNNAKNYAVARDHFEQAVKILEPLPQEQLEKINDRDQLQAEHAWEYLVLAYRKLGDKDNEIMWARKGLKRFPDSPTMHRTLKRYNVPEQPGKHRP